MLDSQIGDLPHLSPARLKFVEGILAGKTKTDAFLEAYPRAENWPRPAVWSNASRVAADRKVLVWLDLARQQGMQKANRTLEGHVSRLEAVQAKAWEGIRAFPEPRDHAPLLRIVLEAEKQHAQALGHAGRDESTSPVTVFIRSYALPEKNPVIDGQAKEVPGPALLDAPRLPCEAEH